MWRNLLDIFTAPKAAFARILQKPTVLIPMLLLLAAMVSIQVGFILTSDRGFLIDVLVEQGMANTSVPEEQLRTAYENLPPNLLIINAAVGTLLFTAAIFLLTALYLNFMSKFGHQGHRYKQWLSLVVWTSMPLLLVALAAWVAMLTGGGQVTLGQLQPLGLDELFAIHSGKSLLQNLSLPQLWSSALLVLGYQYLTNSTLSRAAFITLAPLVLIYGIWAWFSFT